MTFVIQLLVIFVAARPTATTHFHELNEICRADFIKLLEISLVARPAAQMISNN